MKNADSHIILYAKNHYQRNDDVLVDLKILLAERSGCKAEHIRVHDMYHTLFSVFEGVMLGKPISHYLLMDMMTSMAPGVAWKVGANEDDVFDVKIFKLLLSKIANSPVRDNAGNTLIELDPPDKNILPLHIIEETGVVLDNETS
ncbi:hypothetical protein LCGC14_2976930 [marine sediment metagenome]|uniref:Uncharacterized protein n=1 Tax=marine sediment metagenome TaxID=412755 RepID=A0A0F8X7Q4_9ZZZZ